MAKNKIAIDVKVDDKGTTKKVGVQAKKAAKGLDDVGASAHTANRNMKGVSQQSSSGTKNFSKMAQGMGGIVGVYATLAAQAFALSAAFEFLKKVGDLRVLKDSQVAYASTTGIAITSLSRDIRLAADGMLNFEEASKSAAIGLSSGLNAGQLTKLAEGASAVSKVLGRDVSDSYDRLVRGVTKAEPELLDELGITLRLEDAKNKYAIAIGKTVKELTLLEAKQAVAVEVQSQLDKKFISTTSAIEIQGNAMAKFGVAFNDVFVKFAGFIEGPVDAAANFFANNIKSLIAVIGLFALSIIKTMLPSLDSFRARAVESAEQASVAFNKAKSSYDAMKASTSGGVITGALQDVDAKAGSGIDRLKQGKEINKRQAAALLKYAKMEKGVYQRLTKYQKTVYVKALKDILGQKETFWQKAKRGWYGLGTTIDRTAKKSVVVWRSAMVMMTRATTRAASAMNTAMKAAGWIGLALMVIDIGKSIGRATGLIKKPAKALTEYIAQVEATREKMKSLGTEYGKLNLAVSTHLEAVKKLNQSENLQPTITSYKTLGNAVSTTLNEMADLNEQLSQAEAMKDAITIGNGSIGTPEFVTALEESQLSAKGLAAELVKISQNKAFAGLWDSLGMSIQNVVQQFSDSTVAGRISADTLRDVAAELLNLSNVAATFEESYNSSNLAFDKFVQGISQYKTSVTDMLNTTGKEIDMAVDQVGKLGQAMLLTDESETQRDNLKTRLAFLTLINAKETETKNSQLSADRMHALQAHGVTKLVEQRLNREKTVTDLKIKQRQILIDLASLEQGAITMSEEKKTILQQQEAQLREQISLTEKANSAIYKTGMAFWQGFEDGAVTNLAALIKGEKTSFKKAVLGTLLEGLGATADQIASDLVERFMSIIPIFGKKAKTPADLMKESILAGAEEAKIIWAKAFGDAGDVIAKKIEDAAKAPIIPASTKNIATGDIDTKGQVFDSRLAEAAAAAAKDAVALKAAQLAAANKYNNQVNDGSNPNQPLYVRWSSEARMDQITGEKSIAPGMEIRKGSDLDEEALRRAMKVVAPLLPTAGVLEGLEKMGLIIKADKVTVHDNTVGKGEVQENGSTTWEGIMGPKQKKTADKATKAQDENSEEANNNTGALGKATGVIDNAMGTNGTFVTEMKAGFGASLTQLASILGSGGSTSSRGIFSMLLQTGVSAAMGSFFPPAVRTGGIISNGKKVPGYATGGIARGSTSGYPATLHGTEAVVPLGTGRAIPVDMKGSGTSTNNIVVNISTEGQSSTQGSTGPDMEKMGGAIARAVQEELHNQKRSGGILNPYGVA